LSESLAIVAQILNGLFQIAQLLEQLVIPVSQSLVQVCLKAVQFGLFLNGQSPAGAFSDQFDPPLVPSIPCGRQPSLPDGLGQQLQGKNLDRLLFDASLRTQLVR